MHEFTFSDVSCPDRHVVLQLPLRPFAIGHRLILLKQRNPLLWQPEPDFNALDFGLQVFWLAEAVYTCAQSAACRQRLEAGQAGRLELWWHARKIKTWHARVKAARWRQFARKHRETRLWNLLHPADQKPKPVFADETREYYALETALFRNYLNAGRIETEFERRREGFPFLPTSGNPEAEGRFLGAPYDATLIQFLLASRLADSPTAALDYPLALAQTHYLTHLERQGQLRILNADEMAFREDCAARELESARAAGFPSVEDYHADCLEKAKQKKAASDQNGKSETAVNPAS